MAYIPIEDFVVQFKGEKNSSQEKVEGKNLDTAKQVVGNVQSNHPRKVS